MALSDGRQAAEDALTDVAQTSNGAATHEAHHKKRNNVFTDGYALSLTPDSALIGGKILNSVLPTIAGQHCPGQC
jgi:hypothetical protein